MLTTCKSNYVYSVIIIIIIIIVTIFEHIYFLSSELQVKVR